MEKGEKVIVWGKVEPNGQRSRPRFDHVIKVNKKSVTLEMSGNRENKKVERITAGSLVLAKHHGLKGIRIKSIMDKFLRNATV